MGRKAKSEELNQEQLIEMQALFESDHYSNTEITQIIKQKYNITITEGTVRHKAKTLGWVRGRVKEYYNAKKFIKERETLAKYTEDEKEEKIIAKVGKVAERKAREISEIKINKQLEEEKAQEYALKIRSLLLEDMIKVLENGNASDGIMKSFEYNNQGKVETEKTVSKASKYKILNDVKYIDLLKGLGLLQTTPTVAMQVNNGTEVKTINTSEARAKEIATNLLASSIPMENLKDE